MAMTEDIAIATVTKHRQADDDRYSSHYMVSLFWKTSHSYLQISGTYDSQLVSTVTFCINQFLQVLETTEIIPM